MPRPGVHCDPRVVRAANQIGSAFQAKGLVQKEAGL